MGLKRFLWKSTGVGWVAEVYKNSKEKHSILKGVGQTIKEDVMEDTPSPISIGYHLGHKDGEISGEKTGYTKAGFEYEKKLIEQANFFINQKKLLEKERENVLMLLEEYDKTLEEYKTRLDLTIEEKEYYQLLLQNRDTLKNISM